MCPLCNTAGLHVYKDLLVGGQWYRCDRCAFAGDVIELAAAVWQVVPASAYRMLAQKGVAVPGNTLEQRVIDAYVRDHIERRAIGKRFWAETQANGVGATTSLAIINLQTKFRMTSTRLTPSEWARRGGRYIGTNHKFNVEATWQPNGLATRQKPELRSIKGGPPAVFRRHSCVGSDRIFKGPNWGDLLVIPFHDLPGRLVGFLLIGRDGTPEDYIYRSCNVGHIRLESSREAGVAMLDTGLGVHPTLGDTTVMLPVVQAVKLQVRHLADNAVPLPLWGTWHSKYYTRSLWDALPDRPLVVAGSKLTGDMIARARLCHGKIALGEINVNRPEATVRALVRAAVPWEDALEAALLQKSTESGVRLVADAGFSPPEAEQFVNGCAPHARDRVRSFFPHVVVQKRVQCGAGDIIETPEGWVKRRNGEVISSVIIRIDRILYDPDQGLSAYEGRLLTRGKEIPFSAPGKDFEARPYRIVQDVLLREAGIAATVLATWEQKLLHLAKQFHEPTCVRSLGRVGWDDDRSAFIFPRFTIEGSGTVNPTSAAIVPGTTPPCAQFDPPGGLTPAEIVTLGQDDETNRVFWAVAAVVATNALAPLMKWPATGLGLAGSFAGRVGIATARSLGCLSGPPVLPTGQGEMSVRHLAVAIAEHRWPLIAVRTAEEQELTRSILDNLPQPIIARVGSWAAASLAVRGGWHIVEGWSPAAANPAQGIGQAILPNYLRDLATRQFRLPQGPAALAVLDDMAAWFARCGGDTAPIHAGLSTLLADDHTLRAVRFAELVGRAYDSGLFELNRYDLDHPTLVQERRENLAIHPGGVLAIPKTRLNKILLTHGAPALDVVEVTATLASEDILVDHEDTAVWAVKESWWTTHLKRWRAEATRRYRLA